MTEDQKNEHRMRIGQQIAAVRKRRGMTQQDLAERSGIQRAHIARIETGKYGFSIDTLTNICDSMGAHCELIDN